MKVVIVGGGFAGINLALSLAHNIKFQVTLVDKSDHHIFTPFLYQLAAGIFKPGDVSFPFLKMFSGKENLKFHSGELVEVSPAENKIILTNGILEYEYLIVATGSQIQFQGNQNLLKKAFGIATVEDALALKNHLVKQFETVDNHGKVQKLVVVGGGSSGVETSAMLAQWLVDIEATTKLSKAKPEIYLIEKSGSLLASMDVKFQKHAYHSLTELGIKILLNCHVRDYLDDMVLLSSGEQFETKTVIWTAGIKASKFNGFVLEAYGPENRLVVDSFNKVVGTYNVFAIGDVSIQKPENLPNSYPQVAQVAIQQGQNLAENFQLMAERKTLKEFVFKEAGSAIVLGKRKAIANTSRPNIYFYGKVGWFVRLLLQLRAMIFHENQWKMLYRGLYGYFWKR
ncbi:NAD(P)/FAD-dependent oxidoreductase [Dyadobacter sp. CY356]|uniref:NAD(P)/FAD-dependent oxidoreductase n=1 Tax=Dyadobacter sp. CY356 TaxID=2906442 RepID=UPI001F46DC09|nr:FAD-dependent oxidoreductase [Dyadobacter sp. CY356]MCF0058613.1 FAD-dependent oxidoreductase [Dyadobacter sp. CY356]